MLIGSRTIFGAAAALAVVGAMLWGSAVLLDPPQSAQVEIRQIPERSWTVEVKDLGFGTPAEDTKTAALTR